MKTTVLVDLFGKSRFATAEILHLHRRAYAYMIALTPAKMMCTAEDLADYLAAIENLQSVVNRSTVSLRSALIAEADDKRDRCIVWIFETLRNGMRSIFDDQRIAAEGMLAKLKVYEGIATSALGQETAEAEGLIKTLESAEFATATAVFTGMNETVAALKTYNQEVFDLMAERDAEAPTKAETKAKRDAANKIYDTLIMMANASTRALPSPELSAFVASMNALIAQTQAAYNQRMSSSAGGDSTDPTPPADPDLPA